jgi:hypothetical protein
VKEEQKAKLRRFRTQAAIDPQEHLLALAKLGWTYEQYETGVRDGVTISKRSLTRRGNPTGPLVTVTQRITSTKGSLAPRTSATTGSSSGTSSSSSSGAVNATSSAKTAGSDSTVIVVSQQQPAQQSHTAAASSNSSNNNSSSTNSSSSSGHNNSKASQQQQTVMTAH